LFPCQRGGLLRRDSIEHLITKYWANDELLTLLKCRDASRNAAPRRRASTPWALGPLDYADLHTHELGPNDPGSNGVVDLTPSRRDFN
jgi:hypothetical protein